MHERREGEDSLYIGLAEANLLPGRPVRLAGQFFERITTQVHDPITATAFAMERKGGCPEQLILVSCDLVNTTAALTEDVRALLTDRIPDFDVNKLILCAIHTHTAPEYGASDRISTGMIRRLEKYLPAECLPSRNESPEVMTAGEYGSLLAERIADAASRAWKSRAPGAISSASGYAVTGHNRRPVFDDGASRMYGCTHSFHFLRMEGPQDPRVELIYIWNEQKDLKGVLINVPCPAQVAELSSFISADYWHQVRIQLRAALSPELFIVPVCGAAGDLSPVDLIRISRDNQRELMEWGRQEGPVNRNLDEERLMEELGARISGEALARLPEAKSRIDYRPDLRHQVLSMHLPLRTVSADQVELARRAFEKAGESFSSGSSMKMADILSLFGPFGVLEREAEQQRDPFYRFEMHILRLGGAAAVTVPFELFVEYGLRIKAQSRADRTLIAQLSCDTGKYLPTEAAVSGGSYSGLVSSMTTGPDGGALLVREAVAAINSLWD